MDTSQYMPMFLAEAHEHLQELNLAIVALEDGSADHEMVDQIFRIVHSLKGMSATMGFVAIAELTHVMEDVFEFLRQRTGGLSEEAITTVLACLDALTTALESIESDGREDFDPVPLIAQLQAIIRARTPDRAVERAGGASMPDQSVLAAARESGGRILQVRVTLDPGAPMPAVRAHMVLAALNGHGEMLGSIPAPDAIESFRGHQIDAWLVCDDGEEDVARSARRVSDVTHAEVAAMAPDEPAPISPLSRVPKTRTVRVDAARLDALMHLMGEMVIHRTAVEACAADISSPELQHAVRNLARSSQSLQSMVMQVRMITVDVVFMRFPRLVRDLSTKLGKAIELELVGGDTELDRTVVDSVGDPLVHLVRNSLDHGIEPPDARIAAGKPRTGTLTLSARHAGGSIVIEVRDDGRGVDPQAVARKAFARGLIDADTAGQIDMRSAIELLFAPGFSTAERTSDISGRGVGMDAVRARIRELGGDVHVDSVMGQGTTAQIRLPLTLAIISALQVDVAGAQFSIPVDRVERSLRLDEHTVRSIAGRRVLSLDNGFVPLLEGSATFGERSTGAHDLAVIVRGGDKRVGLTVDKLVGQRELVTRPLPPIVSEGQPISGGAVLADGQISLIVDCDALAA